jgi:hypothetical protein
MTDQILLAKANPQILKELQLNYEIGHFDGDWTLAVFKPYDGCVVLRND